MLTSSASLLLGVTFVVVGAGNVWLILQSSAQLKDTKSSARLITAHRIGGYLFIALFVMMAYFMLARLDEVGGGNSPGTTIHLALALIISPLLFVKVLVARYYKSYYGFLMPIGLVIFVLSFVLVTITVAPHLARQRRIETISLTAVDLPSTAIDVNLAASTMEKRCTKCHNLDRVVAARKDIRGWQTTVARMRMLPDSGISEEEARLIFSYLASKMAPKGPVAAAELEVAKALVDQRCGRCHSLDRVYKTAQTEEEWGATVARMAGYAAGGGGAFQRGEARRIVAYLGATQTPDAVKRRKEEAAVAVANPDAGFVTLSPIAPSQPMQPGGRDFKMITFISIVCISMLTLVIRRPARSPVRPMAETVPPVRAAASFSSEPLILRLAHITQQTPDARTLRFIVSNGRVLNTRPGQFLTFTFLFDGKKVSRSYTICSSAARSGYVEITPKRVPNGCVSVFLNDRASAGMTVEAKGPFGHFHLDESKHNSVVMVAAGSGITPMIAMLRYMDDLCLETSATLLYCVRTRDDIIFHAELQELRGRLKNFQYYVSLSQPDGEWPGRRGHISREFIEDAIPQLAAEHFFLCGPPAFMDASRAILAGLGVKPERIRQESFGSVPKGAQPPTVKETGMAAEFVRSGTTCTVRTGQTLLEAAEEHGVAIPSSCRQGKCGTCKTKLLAGNVSMDAEDGLDPDAKRQGFVLTCVGRADSAVKLDA